MENQVHQHYRSIIYWSPKNSPNRNWFCSKGRFKKAREADQRSLGRPRDRIGRDASPLTQPASTAGLSRRGCFVVLLNHREIEHSFLLDQSKSKAGTGFQGDNPLEGPFLYAASFVRCVARYA